MRHKSSRRTSEDVEIISSTVDYCDSCGPACERTMHHVRIGDDGLFLTLCLSKVNQLGLEEFATPLEQWRAATTVTPVAPEAEPPTEAEPSLV